jgi:hypothetical protein
MPIVYLCIKFNIPQPENFKSAVEKALIFNDELKASGKFQVKLK